MKIKVNSYNFNKISSNMSKEFGTIKRGGEIEYSMLLHPMESNLLKMSRLHKVKSGIAITEAIRICLFVIDGYLKNIEYDLADYETDKNKNFVYALLMSCDPFTNNELQNTAKKETDMNSADERREYFKIPIMCMLRIEKSIELWSKEYGPDGYIYFLEDQMGKTVMRDDKMDCKYVAGNLK